MSWLSNAVQITTDIVEEKPTTQTQEQLMHEILMLFGKQAFQERKQKLEVVGEKSEKPKDYDLDLIL